MTIQTDTYRAIVVNAPRRTVQAPQGTKPMPIVSDAIRPLSNRWQALDGYLPPVFTNVELKGHSL